MSAEDSVDELIKQFTLAQGKLLKGNSEPAKGMCSHRQDVTLANPLGPVVHGREQAFAAVDAHGDQMVKVLTAGGRGNGIPIGPVYFLEIMSGEAAFQQEIPAGGRGVVLRVHKLLGRPTHVDLRLPDGKFLLEVPIDYVRTLD